MGPVADSPFLSECKLLVRNLRTARGEEELKRMALPQALKREKQYL